MRLFSAARFVATVAVAAIVAWTPASAQRGVAVVRDAEIEALVRDYARPILQAAGLTKSGINIVLVNDPAFNAFVAGRRMFINTGALLTAETPNEIIGVIAHEAGHLAGGHQERLRDQLARAQTMAVVASVLGIGAAVAGAAAKSGAIAQAGTGMAMGAGEAAKRGLLSYQRTEETTADRSALVYLEKTGQSARGMLITFKRFQSALALSGARIDPYQVSHPMPRERIANLQTLAGQSPYYDNKDPAALQLRHDMARAKIAAFTGGQGAAQRLFRKNPQSLAAQYGDAITTYLYGNLRSAVAKTDALIKANPDNPYFHELRGDVLLKSNRPAEAAEAYSRAIRLDPSKSSVIKISRAQALIATGKPEGVKTAVVELQGALDRDRENPGAYRYLAQAYGQLGEVAQAELATAEGHYYTGNYQDAKIFAARAQQKMKRGTPAWTRAQDILNYRQPRNK